MKYALVTGAAGGMGKATVKKLVENGYTVFALDKKRVESRDNVIPIEVDVTDENSVLSAAETVRKTTDKLDAILHFAGIYMLDSFVEMGKSELDLIFNVNFFGAVTVNRVFFPFLESGSKVVITTSELAPLDPLPFTGVYAVTKSALDRYAYSLRMELQLLNISVSVIRAGAVKTDMLGASTDALEKFCNKTRVYNYNAKRFRKIVDGVETECVPPEKIAAKAMKILNLKKPKFAYSVNCSFLLKILNALPSKLQFYAIRKVLK